MKRILINATHQEELRVALVDGQKLYDLDIEHVGREQKKANIYKGKITRIEPSLEAAFVDYGANRHGFLSLREISSEYYQGKAADKRSPSIKDCVREGQELLVQVDKEERGNKGAALTTYISLAGCYLVLMPNNPKAGGISRRIEGSDRDELKEIMDTLKVPDGMGMIVRTAGVGKSIEELEWDLNYLLHIWSAIESEGKSRPAPCLIHQESDVIVRTIRDHLRKDIGEILVDDAELHQRAQDYLTMLRPDAANHVKLYQDPIPLFSRFQIESQIETAFKREVRLPSGGALVIDHTEALVTIDINSAKATKGGDIEETAFNTNLEAAEEIARQLRLRDLGGLVVIDFIDMTPVKHQREVENRLRDALRVDRARIQVGRISRFGLLEMSRQRLRPSLGESAQGVCPRCNGQGTIRGIESMALSIMRLIEEEALKDNTAAIRAQLPLEVATYLLNEKREQIQELEKAQHVLVQIMPNAHMLSPAYEMTRIKGDETQGGNNQQSSFEMVQLAPTDVELQASPTRATAVEPAVKPMAPPPMPRSSSAGRGLIKRLWSSLFGQATTATKDSEDDSRGSDRKAAKGRQSQSGDRNKNNRRRSEGNTRGKGGNRNRNTRSGGNKNQRNRPKQDEARNKPRQDEAKSSRPARDKQASDKQTAAVKPASREPRPPAKDQPRQKAPTPVAKPVAAEVEAPISVAAVLNENATASTEPRPQRRPRDRQTSNERRHRRAARRTEVTASTEEVKTENDVQTTAIAASTITIEKKADNATAPTAKIEVAPSPVVVAEPAQTLVSEATAEPNVEPRLDTSGPSSHYAVVEHAAEQKPEVIKQRVAASHQTAPENTARFPELLPLAANGEPLVSTTFSHYEQLRAEAPVAATTESLAPAVAHEER